MLKFVVTVVAALVLSSPALAHGVKSTDGGAALAQFSWLTLLSPAQAAVTMRIETSDGHRYITSDGLPDHSTGPFPSRGNPNRLSAQNHRFRVALEPQKTGRFIPLRRSAAFGVAINGVPFDPSTAENWNNDPRSGWAVEALGGAMDLGIDRSNAHVQPSGAYHYHGIPVGLLQRFAGNQTPILIGYAADGFPIYGPYGHRDANDAASPLVELKSGWRLKPGIRPHGREGPGGPYNGFYTQDWEFVGSSDLDECNGRAGITPEYPRGVYHYVVTTAFPMIPRCFAGQPDPSFDKGPPGGGSPSGRPPPPGVPPPR